MALVCTTPTAYAGLRRALEQMGGAAIGGGATALLLVLNQAFSKQRWGRRELVAFLEGNGRVFVELVAILAGVGLPLLSRAINPGG